MGKKSLISFEGKENVEEKEKICEGMIKLRKKSRATCELNKRCVLGVGGNWKSQWKYDISVLPLELCPIFPALFTINTTLNMYLEVVGSTRNIDHLFFLIKGLNSLLTIPNVPIGPFIQENTHRLILKLMPTPQLAKDCVGCFINLTSNYSCTLFVEEGLIEILLGLLETCDDELANLCVWCLGNIAGDSIECRNAVHNKGSFEKIEKRINSTLCKENSLWLISNLCKGKPAPPAEFLKKACELVLNPIEKDPKIQFYALETVFYCTNHLPILSNEQISDILNIAEVNKGNNFLALKIIGNLVVLSKDYAHCLLEKNVLSILLQFIKDGSPKEKKEALLITSNLCVDLDHYLSIFLNHDLLKECLSYLIDKDEDLKIEAIWILRNLTKFEDSFEILHKLGFFHDFLSVFQDRSGHTLIPALESLNSLLLDESFHNLFEKNNTMYHISRLTSHTNISIRVLSYQVTQYFTQLSASPASTQDVNFHN